jgi:hypothetical protein
MRGAAGPRREHLSPYLFAFGVSDFVFSGSVGTEIEEQNMRRLALIIAVGLLAGCAGGAPKDAAPTSASSDTDSERWTKVRRHMRELRDPDPETRCEAARRLGSLGDSRAVPALISTLRDEVPEVTPVAVAALREITGEDFGDNADKWEVWYEGTK